MLISYKRMAKNLALTGIIFGISSAMQPSVGKEFQKHHSALVVEKREGLSLSEALKQAHAWVKSKGFQPHEVAWIFDVDGTLTKHATALPEKYDSTDARERPLSQVREILKQGGHVFFSSASRDFEDQEKTGMLPTVKRLRGIGFTDQDLGVEASQTAIQKKSQTVMNKTVDCYALGHIASCMSPLDQDQRFFRGKLIAPLAVEEKTAKYKAVIFLDDSPDNITHFNKEVTNFGSIYAEKEAPTQYLLLTLNRYVLSKTDILTQAHRAEIKQAIKGISAEQKKALRDIKNRELQAMGKGIGERGRVFDQNYKSAKEREEEEKAEEQDQGNW